jgi:hypothetical protein
VFAHHIVDSYAAGNTAEFPAFFDVLERLVIEGDHDVFGLATVGLIEDIQNVASHTQFGYSVFEKWLAPRSKGEWLKFEAAWNGSHSLAEVIRKEGV